MVLVPISGIMDNINHSRTKKSVKGSIEAIVQMGFHVSTITDAASQFVEKRAMGLMFVERGSNTLTNKVRKMTV